MQNSDPQSALFSQISPISGPQPTSAAWRRREMEGTSLSMEGHYRALWAAREGPCRAGVLTGRMLARLVAVLEVEHC